MTTDDTKFVSRRLAAVLDIAGASQYVRKTRQHCSLVTDVLTTMLMLSEGSDVAIYTFGSSSEGTTTPGMGSDRDTLMCFLTFPVFECVSDVNPDELRDEKRYENVQDSSHILMVHDDSTPLGFTKLEFITTDDEIKEQFGKMLQVEKDINGKEVLNNNGMIQAMTQDERNGPAATTLERPGFTDLDYIPAFRCKKWPKVAEEFITRKRKFDFPSKDVRKDFGGLGIFLVPTGQSESPERHLQWRLSFSLQERKIMLNLNETQYKCYILLKIMKTDFIKPLIPEKSLTSYHCKTSLFFLMEDTEISTWTNDNLAQLFMQCVSMLRKWVNEGFIPSYFMPTVNLWKGNDNIRKQVVGVLEDVLEDVPKALTRIQCDNVGNLLQDALESTLTVSPEHGSTEQDYFDNSSRQLHLAVNRLHCAFIGGTVDMVEDLLLHTRYGDDLDKCILSHRRLVAFLENTKELSNVTTQEKELVEMAAIYALPFVYTSLGSQLAARNMLTGGENLKESMEFLEKGRNSDFLAGQVKFAAILFAQEKYEECLALLEALHIALDQDIITIGMCGRKLSDNTFTMLVNEALLEKMITTKPSSKEILQNNTATCVVFLPTELPLMPKDLQYEQFRSFGAKDEAIEDTPNWYEIVAVDSKILLYYLLYRTHETLGNDPEKMAAFVFLNAILENDHNLSHPDTAHNLIGCLLREMGHFKAALDSFNDSWQKRPEHNAAKWHVLVTCFEFLQLVHELDLSDVSSDINTSNGHDVYEEIIYQRQ